MSLRDLQQQLTNGLVVPVIGSGVSTATAGIPGWKGIIESGLRHAAETMSGRQEEIATAYSRLSEGDLTGAAQTLKGCVAKIIFEREISSSAFR